MTTADPSTTERRTAPDAPRAVAPRLGAEAFGTFLLVLGGVGTALFAAAFPSAQDNALGVGHLGVALAFGLALLAGILLVGRTSGGHFNPAVTLGFAIAGRFAWRDVPGYVVAQLVGGALASSVLVVVASTGPSGFLANAQESGFASNGWGAHSPGGFGLLGVLLTEALLTGVFVAVILAVTARAELAAIAPFGISLTLTVVHLISIPISNTSVNPARSIATAIYGGPDALAQVWAFILAPIVGGLIAGALHRAAVLRAGRLG
ncbi:aquaporin [Amnibacterium kyonggiense]|uniref:Aquaporin Z n=1 Tax=Amnibacterium kyonggiense TaxID=595671 RepID=A0A4R7FPE7_9MICO|nr:aquaporin [Amnibacterium kyonggiense]TDS79611.1 aquaporin Z [Amnibacterium kyonggiense]